VSPPILGGRREAREQALLLLYEAEIRGLAPDAMADEVVVEPETYTLEVLAGVTEHRERLDGLLTGRTGDWPLHRLAAMDRAVLNLAAWELIERDDVPTAVVLNEAVELAKTYGTDDSGGFVNGVLVNLAKEVRPGTVVPQIVVPKPPAAPPADAVLGDAEPLEADPERAPDERG